MNAPRIRAERLALVNWRGVFYAELAMDRHVTALEGDNGAGKTTALIATYVVLLPDLGRLRFTNLGEGEATGGDRGIWGRLGDPGRPAYAWLSFRADDGERVLFGVQLRKGAEPAVELQTLCIRGLADDVALPDALLHRALGVDGVPELAELREAVTNAGARLEVFASAKDYFAALFDAGVTPLRLTEGDARARFNEVLRTSMTGGLSRGLTRDLRRFVLEAEESLGSTLKRMQENLDACHRSRLDVEQARALQQEIGDVYAAGHAMFRAGMQAARRADDAANRVFQAKVEQAERVRAEAADLDRRDDALAGRAAGVREQIAAGRETLENNRARLDRTRKAHDLAAQIAEHEAALAPLREAKTAADEALQTAEVARAEAVARRNERRTLLDEATAGLHDAEAGLESLQARAARHERARRTLGQARDALGEPDLAPDAAAAARPRVQARRDAVDARRRSLRRDLDTARQRRAAWARAQEALDACGLDVPPAEAYDAARGLLAEGRRLADLAAQGPTLAREVRALEDVVRRRARMIERLSAVFDDDQRPRTAGQFDDELLAAERAVAEADRAVREAAGELEDAANERLARREAQADARREAARHAELRRGVADAAASFDWAVETAADLRALHAEATRQEAEAGRAVLAAEAEVAALDRAFEALDELGRGLAPALQQAAEAVGGTPLVARFEAVDVEDAGLVEARLGPLVEAVVVDDAWAAAETWPEDAPDHVWLIETHDARRRVDEAGGKPEEEGVAGVLARYGDAWRLTRPPELPVVGRAARAQRRAALEVERGAADRRAEAARGELARVQAATRRVAALLPDAEVLDRADPAEALARADEALAVAERGVTEAREARTAAEQAARAARARLDALRGAATDAALLDEPDPEGALDATRLALEGVAEAEVWLAQAPAARDVLQAELETLREPPLGEGAEADAADALAEADAERDALDAADEALAAFAQVRDAYDDVAAPAELAELRLGHADARRRVDAAREAEHAASQAADAALDALETARSEAGRLDAQVSMRAAQITQAQAAMQALGLGRPSAGDVAEADRAVRAANDRLEHLNDTERQIAHDRGELAGRRDALARELRRADGEADAARDAWAPLRARWRALEQRCVEAGLGEVGPAEADAGDARVHRARLVERLRRARDAAQVAAAVEAQPAEPEGDLEAWRLTREWLRRCLPARLADTPDPRLGLERLSEHLTALEGRLNHQEQVLAGSAADVAHYVRQLRRRARRQVDLLNELLAPIAFGSIAGVRLQMTDVEQMEALLDGLSDQADLFKPGLPIDEALDRLFQRVGGTPGSARLLDYREYFDLQVHVQRQSDPTWRLANPTRMSTGEAIGVGAALMMVVLHAWEAQNRLSRKQSDLNTLRLLFLDEANRLSADNLGVLIDLCRTLELQLLIAAPRVDEAAGNTTYRLARVTTPDGREEVRLTGRRVRAGGTLVDRIADPEVADIDFDPPPWRDPPAADD